MPQTFDNIQLYLRDFFKSLTSHPSIGLEATTSGFKCASLSGSRNLPKIVELKLLDENRGDVKQLYINHPVINTAISGRELLIRPLQLPLTKDKDIDEAVAFQAEPLLPYPLEQALLSYQVISKAAENSDLTLFSVRKEAVSAHISFWQEKGIEPEKISCVQTALCNFCSTYLKEYKTFLILHLQHDDMTCCLIHEGKLWTSFSKPIGFNTLLEGQAKEGLSWLPQDLIEWQNIEDQKNSPLADALKKLQLEAMKMVFALMKECKSGSIEGLIITGESAKWEGLEHVIASKLNLPFLKPNFPDYSAAEMQSYAVPIGLAIGSLEEGTRAIDFRQQELSYPNPWHRLKAPLVLYMLSVLLVTASFYFFGNEYLKYQTLETKQKYIEFLANIQRTHKDLELAYSSKTSKDSSIEEPPQLEQMSTDEFANRLAFLQKELQSSPDSFPLLPNTPRVSDVLAWLTQHPAVLFVDNEGGKQSKLVIENFNYTMVKRPQQGKKQEKYQVKIELEFSSPTPKWAREFHDALISPNDWIDPKGEVKWNANRGKYKTSFFLKDKTAYPSL